ncbi:MAG: porin family protein, partial [Spirochaetia bacterium]|nr:porin family protein [Spirochaetia bacterium]
MKRTAMTVITLMIASAVCAADAPAALTETAAAVKTAAAAVTTTAAAAVESTVSAVTATAAAVTITARADAAPVAAVDETGEQIPYIEGITPPSVEEGVYEDASEPFPSGDELGKSAGATEARKNKHYLLEATFFTPSSLGLRTGYYINENWRVMGEYSLFSAIMARSSDEKNDSWAVNVNYTPAEDDWSPFYGIGYSYMDVAFGDTVDSEAVNVKKRFSGAYLSTGVNWITDSIFTLTIEFDLYC